MEKSIDVNWEEVKVRRRLITVRDWLFKNNDATMWRFAWSIWWRIMLMSIGTFAIFSILFLLGMIW